MQQLVSAMLVVVALIHLLPLSGALGAARLRSLYGIALDEPNLLILMRHRAVLFGLLAAFLAYAAFHPRLHGLALVAGAVSVFSFLVLAGMVGGYNPALGTVVKVDIVAAVLLAVGFAFHLRGEGGP